MHAVTAASNPRPVRTLCVAACVTIRGSDTWSEAAIASVMPGPWTDVSVVAVLLIAVCMRRYAVFVCLTQQPCAGAGFWLLYCTLNIHARGLRLERRAFKDLRSASGGRIRCVVLAHALKHARVSAILWRLRRHMRLPQTGWIRRTVLVGLEVGGRRPSARPHGLARSRRVVVRHVRLAICSRLFTANVVYSFLCATPMQKFRRS